MAKKKRYFIVFYYGIYPAGQGDGSVNVKTDGAYVNFRDITKMLENEHNFSQVAFTNIIELSKKDFEDWEKEIAGG